MRPKAPAPKRILIVLPRQLGDILLGSSLAFAMRDKFPQAHIAWLAHPMGKQLLAEHPALNAVHYHPAWKGKAWKTIVSHPLLAVRDALKHIWAEFAFLSLIRNEKFDLVIDSICTPRTAIITRWSGAQRRYGLPTRWNRNWAYSWLCGTEGWRSKYAAQARLNLVEPLLDPAEHIHPPAHWLDSWIPPSRREPNPVELFVAQHQLSTQTFAVLSPTHRRPLRRWPTESYVKLALKMVQELGLKIVWMWGPGEFEFTEPMHKALQSELKRAGLSPENSLLPPLFTLPEVALLAGQADIWVGNSNGLSHVAVAGGARTVQIHGPTSPLSWTHPNHNKHKAVQRSDGCIGCESNSCRIATHECLAELSVEDVYGAVRQIRMASQHSE